MESVKKSVQFPDLGETKAIPLTVFPMKIGGSCFASRQFPASVFRPKSSTPKKFHQRKSVGSPKQPHTFGVILGKQIYDLHFQVHHKKRKLRSVSQSPQIHNLYSLNPYDIRCHFKKIPRVAVIKNRRASLFYY